MTKDEIIDLAKEAGFRVKNFTIPTIAAQHSNGSWVSIDEELEAFANAIQAKERERCAKRIEQDLYPAEKTDYQGQYNAGIKYLADQIRSLG